MDDHNFENEKSKYIVNERCCNAYLIFYERVNITNENNQINKQ